MRSPFQSEPEAFRSVLAVLLALLAIVLAAVLGPAWLALAVLAVMLVGLVIRATQLRIRKQRLDRPLKSAPPHVGSAADRRVLVVANDTLGELALLGEVERLASVPHTHVLMLAPALVSSGARLTGAVDGPVDQARVRLAAVLDRVGQGLDIAGDISEAEPLQAVEDAFATFAPDEVIVCTRRKRTRSGLEPRLAALVRERFAVPVRHLVFDPGLGAREPDRETEARYRREFDDLFARKSTLVTLAGVGILASLVMSMAALVRSGESASPQPVVSQAAATAPVSAVIALKIIPSSKPGPDGKVHDAFTKTEFAVSVGRPVQLRIDNTDSQPHSITAPEAGVNITAMPGIHTYTMLVTTPGRFQWFCVYPCDSEANGWAMRHAGYMSGYITAS